MTPALASCPDGYVFQAEFESCVKYSASSATYDNAKAFCQASGGRLFSASTEAKNDFLHSLGGGLAENWIGLKYSGGNWNW